MKKKAKQAGRPPAAINQKNAHGRTETAAGFRCSQGYKKVTDMLIGSGLYKSKADIYHEALTLLAKKRNLEVEHFNYWVNKIE